MPCSTRCQRAPVLRCVQYGWEAAGPGPCPACIGQVLRELAGELACPRPIVTLSAWQVAVPVPAHQLPAHRHPTGTGAQALPDCAALHHRQAQPVLRYYCKH
jgi:hypothetical protein